MELYLPTEESVETVDEVYQKPINKDGMEELSTLVGDEAEDAEISAVFPVCPARSDAIPWLTSSTPHTTGYGCTKCTRRRSRERSSFSLSTSVRPSAERAHTTRTFRCALTCARQSTRSVYQLHRKEARVDVQDIQDEVKWTKTRVGFREEFEDETQARERNSEQVTDSAWVSEQLRQIRGTNAAQGLGEAIDDE
jgi:hypothetical protein